jgi:CubicO group peptidase (beta-lactamase class C family)
VTTALRVYAPAMAVVVAFGVRAAQPSFPRATPAEAGLASAPLAEATALLTQFVAEKKIAGAVAAVARHGKLGYLEAVGVQDLETRASMTDRSLFRLYSMTKPVTAVAVMMLFEAGRFGLSDPVSKYLPEFKDVRVAAPDGTLRQPAREITVQDLLLHTSGFSHRTSELYRTARVRVRTDTLPQFITKITHAPLMEDPGTRFRYSEGTTVLGRLVEIWSGKPFDAFLDERVFKPLNMTDTGFWVRPEQRARLAMVYQSARGGGLTPFEIEPEAPFTVRPVLLEGAVGLVSTVPDYLRFSQMLLNRGEGRRAPQRQDQDMMTANAHRRGTGEARGGTRDGASATSTSRSTPASMGGTARPARSSRSIRRELVTVLRWQTVPADPDGLRALQGARRPGDRSIMNTMKHLTTSELEAGLDEVARFRKSRGPGDDRAAAAGGERDSDEGHLDLVEGLVGDSWKLRTSRRTADGTPHPDMTQPDQLPPRLARGAGQGPLASSGRSAVRRSGSERSQPSTRYAAVDRIGRHRSYRRAAHRLLEVRRALRPRCDAVRQRARAEESAPARHQRPRRPFRCGARRRSRQQTVAEADASCGSVSDLAARAAGDRVGDLVGDCRRSQHRPRRDRLGDLRRS